jgi:hypothetical protein
MRMLVAAFCTLALPNRVSAHVATGRQESKVLLQELYLFAAMVVGVCRGVASAGVIAAGCSLQ